MKKKAIVAVVALVLVLCCAMGGTLAWLKDQTNPVVNTFTYGDINIGLSESDDLDLKMIPGNDIKKDPTVTVKANSEASWLFVKIEESDNFDDFMTYGIADGWKQLTVDAEGNAITDLIYYREVAAKSADTEFAILKYDKVHVNETVLKTQLNAFDSDEDGVLSDEEKKALPTLTFTAYAVQKDNVNSAADAWKIAKPQN